MSLPLPRRKRIVTLDETAKSVLVHGVDVFRDFKGADGAARLHALWREHGKQILDEHVAKDPTTRPAAWWWWSAPMSLRLPYPTVLFATKMRARLLEAGLLKGDIAEVAKRKVQAFRASGKPVAFYDASE